MLTIQFTDFILLRNYYRLVHVNKQNIKKHMYEISSGVPTKRQQIRRRRENLIAESSQVCHQFNRLTSVANLLYWSSPQELQRFSSLTFSAPKKYDLALKSLEFLTPQDLSA